MATPQDPTPAAPSLPVTSAPITQPFETPVYRIGRGGVNLRDEVDQLQPEQCARMTNVEAEGDGVQARAGQTSLATTTAGKVTGIGRLDRPRDSTYVRFVGVNGTVYSGQAGVLADLGVAFSGDPLTFVPHRPPQSGEAWMFVADRNDMRMIRADGVNTGLGRTPPGAPAVALATERKTVVCQFDTSDATDAANWAKKAGVDDTPTTPVASGVPTASDVTGKSGNAVKFTTAPGAVRTGYTSWWSKGQNLDLSKLSDGTRTYDAGDADLLHLWLRLDNPDKIEEVRFYIVVATNFNPDNVPGTVKTLDANQDFYVKSFRPGDFAKFVVGTQSQDQAATDARATAINDDDLKRRQISGRSELDTEVYGPGPDDDRTSWETRRAQIDPARRRSLSASSALGEWVEFGTIGQPLRRGDFQRIGSTSGRDWSTVTGFFVWVKTTDKVAVSLAFDQAYLTGGAGPDTTEAGSAQLTYKVTHYDTYTGIESNGSTASAAIDAMRRAVSVDPAGTGDAWVRQRVYRQGGTLKDNWYFVGQNDADGAVLLDELTDAGIQAAGTVPIDHYKAVPTVDSNGNTILGQPLPALWGPLNGMLFACGDPYRPGHLYWCLPDEPGHWPADFNYEVCAPSEQLMHGCVYADQGWVFSRKRLYVIYPNLTGTAGQVIVNPTGCTPGLASRWALAVTPYGIAYGHETGIYLTTGGAPTLLSDLPGGSSIRTLFLGLTKEGRLPIDFTVPTAFTLAYANHRLYLTYQDTGGARRVAIYSFIFKYWRFADFARPVSRIAADLDDQPLLGGAASGAIYQHTGFNDDGVAIAATLRTGAWDLGRPREDKLLGDIILDADLQQTVLTAQSLVDNEQVSNGAQFITVGNGRERYVFQPFGPDPQRARNVQLEITWSAAAKRPAVYLAGVAVLPEPDVTTTRVTQWDDAGSPNEKYATGVMLECDTFGIDRPLVIEGDLGGVVTTLYSGTIRTSGRHRVFLSWTAAKTHLLRVRPTDPNESCPPWILYRVAWFAEPEPPRLAAWDSNWQSAGDTYYTGLDLECDTFGATKTIEVYVDGVLIDTQTVTANGRRLVHLTFTPGRGHLYKFRATDAHDGLLYSFKWYLDAEPSEQTNWNQNYSIAGSLSDKYLKGAVIECDTFGQNKTVNVEVDGAVVQQLTVNTNGRKVVHLAIPQALGRVFRLLPVDNFPSRLYSFEWLFDEEPYSLDRWETQELTHGVEGWFVPIDGDFVLKSTDVVTVTLTVYGQAAAPRTLVYQIPSTAGVKISNYVPFDACKARQIKYLLTSPARFTLYRDESVVRVAPWATEGLVTAKPFGNDDVAGRPMNHAARLAAASNERAGV